MRRIQRKFRFLHDYPVVRMPRIKLRGLPNLGEMEAWGYRKGMYRQVRVGPTYWPMVGLN